MLKYKLRKFIKSSKKKVKNYRTSRFVAIMSIAVMGLSLLTSCNKNLPPAFVYAHWESASTVDREYVVKKMDEWVKRSRDVEGELMVRDWEFKGSDKKPIVVKRIKGWKSVKLEGEIGEWSKKPIGSVESPVTIWSRDMVDGEYFEDIVICREERCTDVSAWYILAHMHEALGFPDEVEGVVPQDAATYSRVSMVDPWVLSFYLKSIDSPVEFHVYSKKKKKTYTLKDRVYIKGERRGAMGVEECVGWFDWGEEMNFDEDRFTYFCFLNKIGVVSGANRESGIVGFRPFGDGLPEEPGVVADLYGDLPAERRAFLNGMGFVEKRWAERHDKALSLERRAG